MTLSAAVALIESHGGTVRIGPRRIRRIDAHIDGGFVHAVTREICRRFGVRLVDVQGKQRHGLHAHPRRVVYWALRQTGLSWPDIGRELRKDHSSVIHGYRRCTWSDRKTAVRAIRAVEARHGVRLLP